MAEIEIQLAENDTTPPDVIAYQADDTDTSKSRFNCEVCGTGLTYGGRGRYPRFCDDHKPTKPQGGGTRSSGKNVDVLIGQMTDLYLTASTVFTLVPPTALDGMVLAQNANKLAESWRPLIERDPKIRKFWERICSGGGWGSVLFAHGLVAMAIMNNHNVSLPFMPKASEQGV